MNNFLLIEALLYVRGEDGLTPKDLKDSLEKPTSVAETRKELKTFMESWNMRESGLQVVEFNDVFKFATKEAYNPFITRLVVNEKKQRLSNSAIETIGIIAYKQPISRSQIADIRGTNSDATVNTLLAKGLIEEKGISENGRTILYGTTDKFYDYFQLRSLRELPKLSEFSDSSDSDEIDLFSSQREEF